ncbi:hypothetical protein CDD83_9610 [Cordyceps sp. RAO-2017]|nr:hypothetical protein CDD83_9610 [Cordyceps sp. RAO-2017]
MNYTEDEDCGRIDWSSSSIQPTSQPASQPPLPLSLSLSIIIPSLPPLLGRGSRRGRLVAAVVGPRLPLTGPAYRPLSLHRRPRPRWTLAVPYHLSFYLAARTAPPADPRHGCWTAAYRGPSPHDPKAATNTASSERPSAPPGPSSGARPRDRRSSHTPRHTPPLEPWAPVRFAWRALTGPEPRLPPHHQPSAHVPRRRRRASEPIQPPRRRARRPSWMPGLPLSLPYATASPSSRLGPDGMPRLHIYGARS